MVKPDPYFRPDPTRAINIFGQFSDELVASVLPQIAAFRASGNKPITVYINSNGGLVRCLEIIIGAITSEDLDGNYCSMITVASGDAASAAASLFTLGRYAIAYGHSNFHFHGIRLNEVEITMEDASSLASYLSSRNREIALRLAEAVIARLVHRYSILVDGFAEYRRRAKDKHLTEEECFVESARHRVSPSAQRILARSLAHIKRVDKLTAAVFGKIKLLPEDSGLKQDADVLRAVLDYEINSIPSEEWRLHEQELAQLSSDFLLLRDFFHGEHEQLLEGIVQTLGYFFLSARDTKQLRKLRSEKKDNAAIKFLNRKAGPIVRRFWYFTVVLCRQLQQGENRLEAEDAYWLGLADEVVGLGLTGIRAIMEEEVSPNGEPEKISAPD